MVGGSLEFDFLFNSARPAAQGVPFFLAPASPFGFDQNTFNAHARQTSIYAALVGPEVGGFKAGGFILANFFNDAIIVDRYGFLPIQAYGDLKNSDWRFAAGLQVDIFAPIYRPSCRLVICSVRAIRACFEVNCGQSGFFIPATTNRSQSRPASATLLPRQSTTSD